MYKLLLPAALVAFLLTPGPSSADNPCFSFDSVNLLANCGFETGDTSGWTALNGQLEALTAGNNTGSFGGLLTSNGLAAVASIAQTVAVEPRATYRLSGWALLDDSNTDHVTLKIEWLDQDGQATAFSESEWMAARGTHTIISIAATAPDRAASARIVGQAFAVQHGPFTAYFDDLVFTRTAPAPPTAAPTASPPPIPTLPPPSVAATTPPDRTPGRTPTRAPPTRTPAITPVPEPIVFDALANGGFEQAGQDGPLGWRKIGGTMARSGAKVRSGSYSLSLTSETASTKWAYQAIAVTPGEYYRASAYAQQSNPQPGEAFLRLSWYASSDGSGEAIVSDDSSAISGNTGAFQFVSTSSVQAPSNAHSVRVRLMFRPAGASPATAHYDDVVFAVASPPTDAPEATRTPPPSPGPTARAQTSTPRPTRTNGNATSAPSPPPDGTAPEPASFGSLVNGGFEEAREDGTPYGWHKTGGASSVSPANHTEGDLGLEMTSDTSSTKWTYQAVQVTPGSHYRATAWALNTGPGDQLFLRISWYSGDSGEGPALSDVDSTEIVTGRATDFRPLDTGPVRAPGGARSARIRLVLRPASASATHSYFDDVQFGVTNAPPAAVAAAGGSGGRPPAGGQPSTAGDLPGEEQGAGAAVTTPQAAFNGAPDGSRAVAGVEGGSGTDWLLAVALAIPITGIVAVLGMPVVRRWFDTPPRPGP